jgi:hypothetical protein
VITLEQYVTEHAKPGDAPPSVRANATDLLARVNTLLLNAAAGAVDCAAEPVLASGWRPPAFNATVPNAAPNSKHMTGQAVDVRDPDGELDDWCVRNLETLADLGLWMEHPASTKGWTHLQNVAPRSGNRIFYP